MVRRILRLAGVLLLGMLALGLAACRLTGQRNGAVSPTPTLGVLSPATDVARPVASPFLAPTYATPPLAASCPTAPRWPPAFGSSGSATCRQYSEQSPGQVPWIAVTTGGGVVEVQWAATGSLTEHYDVYRQSPATGGWERVAQVMRAPNAVEDKTAYAWRDTGVMPGTTYRYGVAGVNGYGRSGPMLPSRAITAP